MTLEVKEATAADAAASIAIENAAYAGGPLEGILFNQDKTLVTSPDDARAEQLSQEIQDDLEVRLMKVADLALQSRGEQSSIAFAKWYKRGAEWTLPKRTWPPGANVEACELFFGRMVEAYTQHWSGKPHMYLKLLHTDPKHQGRGAGSLLLKQLTEDADELKLPCYLESTGEGKSLYEKFGFRLVSTLLGDFTKWGGPETYPIYLMARSASD